MSESLREQLMRAEMKQDPERALLANLVAESERINLVNQEEVRLPLPPFFLMFL